MVKASYETKYATCWFDVRCDHHGIVACCFLGEDERLRSCSRDVLRLLNFMREPMPVVLTGVPKDYII